MEEMAHELKNRLDFTIPYPHTVALFVPVSLSSPYFFLFLPSHFSLLEVIYEVKVGKEIEFQFFFLFMVGEIIYVEKENNEVSLVVFFLDLV